MSEKYGPPDEFNCPKCTIKMKFMFHFGYDQRCNSCQIFFEGAGKYNSLQFVLKVNKDITSYFPKYNIYYGNSFEECVRKYKLKAFE